MACLELQDALELVAKARTDVVRFRLERHAENADGHHREVKTLFEARNEIERQTFVNHHARLPEVEVVVVEGGQLHRVLEQAGPRSEAGPGQVICTWVIL